MNPLALFRKTVVDTGYAVLGAADLTVAVLAQTVADAGSLPKRAADLQEQAVDYGRQVREYLDAQVDVLSRRGREVAARMQSEDGIVAGEVVDAVDEPVRAEPHV